MHTLGTDLAAVMPPEGAERLATVLVSDEPRQGGGCFQVQEKPSGLLALEGRRSEGRERERWGAQASLPTPAQGPSPPLPCTRGPVLAAGLYCSPPPNSAVSPGDPRVAALSPPLPFLATQMASPLPLTDTAPLLSQSFLI